MCTVNYKGESYNEDEFEIVENLHKEVEVRLKQSNAQDVNNFYGYQVVTDKGVNVNAIAEQYIEQAYPTPELDLKKEFLADKVVEDPNQDANIKLELMKQALPNVHLIQDTTISESGVLLGTKTDKYKQLLQSGVIKSNTPVIVINPDLLFSDTIFHEYGHLYIDLLGGYNNDLIVNAINQLKDSKLWKKVENEYKDKEVEDLGKEVLATAIGLEAQDIFNNTTDPNKVNLFNRILDRLLVRLGKLLGVEVNYAKELAKDLLWDRVSRKELVGKLSYKNQEQRIVTGQNAIFSAIVSDQNKFFFDEENHVYYYQKVAGQIKQAANIVGTSVTKLIKPSFDAESMALEKAVAEVVRLSGLPNGTGLNALSRAQKLEVERIALEKQNYWELQALVGTGLHAMAEDIINGKVLDLSAYSREEQQKLNSFIQAVTRIKNEAARSGAKILSEVKVYDPEADVAGTVDILLVYPNGTIGIYDFKTSTKDVFKVNSSTPTNTYMQYKAEGHTKQLYAYAKILQNMYGVRTSKMMIIPVKIGIDRASQSVNYAKVQDHNLNVKSFSMTNSWANEVFALLPSAQEKSDIINGLYEAGQIIMNETTQTVIKFIDKAKFNIKNKISILKHKNRDEAKVSDLAQLYNELDLVYSDETLLKYIVNVANRTADILDRLYVLRQIAEASPNQQSRSTDLAFNRLEALQEIQNLHHELESFNIINDIKEASYAERGLESLFDTKGEFNLDGILKSLPLISDSIVKAKVLVKKEYHHIAAKAMSKHTNKGSLFIKRRYEEQFEQENPKKKSGLGTKRYLREDLNTPVSKKVYNSRKRKYVSEHLHLNQVAVRTANYDYAKAYIEQMPFDISKGHLFQDPREINNDVVQSLISMLEDVEYKVQRTVQDTHKQALVIYDEFKKQAGYDKNNPILTNVEKLYDTFINKDSNGKNSEYFVTEYNPEFLYGVGGYFEVSEKTKELRRKADEATEQASTLRMQGLDGAGVLEIESQKLLKQSNKLWADWFAANTTKETRTNSQGIDEEITVPNDSWKDPRFQEASQSSLYNYMMERMKLDDATIIENNPHLTGKQIGVEFFGTTFYKIPSMSKSNVERVVSTNHGSFIERAKGFVKDKLTVQVDDTEFGETVDNDEASFDEDVSLVRKLLDVNNEEVKKVPIHYRGQLGNTREEHIKNLSYNLLQGVMANHYMSQNFNEKSKVQIDVELLKLAVGDGKVNQTEGLKNVVGFNKMKEFNPFSKKKEEVNVNSQKKVTESRIYAQVENIIDQKLYGISTIKSGNGKRTKIIQALTGWSAHIGLDLNITSAVTNAMNGAVMNAIESAGGRYLNPKSLAKAHLRYYKGGGGLRDVGRNKIVSDTGLFLEKFDMLHEFNGSVKKFTNTSFIKNAWSANSFMFLQHAGEHYLSSTLMYGVLENIKIQNENKEYIDLEGNVVAEKDAISLADAYETKIEISLNGTSKLISPSDIKSYPDWSMTKTRHLVLNEHAKISDYDNMPLNQEYINLVRRRMKETSYYLHGMYDSKLKAITQRQATFNMLWMYKRWMGRYLLRRFRGFGTVLKDKNEVREAGQIFYSEVLGEELEGYYITMYRMTGRQMREIKSMFYDLYKTKDPASLNQFGNEWFNLSDTEKESVHKAIVDIGFQILLQGTIALVMGGIGGGDEEPKKKESRIKREAKELQEVKDSKLMSDSQKESQIEFLKDKHVRDLEKKLIRNNTSTSAYWKWHLILQLRKLESELTQFQPVTYTGKSGLLETSKITRQPFALYNTMTEVVMLSTVDIPGYFTGESFYSSDKKNPWYQEGKEGKVFTERAYASYPGKHIYSEGEWKGKKRLRNLVPLIKQGYVDPRARYDMIEGSGKSKF